MEKNYKKNNESGAYMKPKEDVRKSYVS